MTVGSIPETNITSAGIAAKLFPRMLHLSAQRDDRERVVHRRAGARLLPSSSRTQLLAPDELQGRPVLVERGDLDVHQPPRQDELAQAVLADVADVAGRLARPGDPQRTAGIERSDQHGETAFELCPAIEECDDQIEWPARAGAHGDVVRQAIDRPVPGPVEQCDGVTGAYAELLDQRCARIAGHGDASYTRLTAPGSARSRALAAFARRKAPRFIAVQRRGADSGLATNAQRPRGEQAAACRRPPLPRGVTRCPACS